MALTRDEKLARKREAQAVLDKRNRDANAWLNTEVTGVVAKMLRDHAVTLREDAIKPRALINYLEEAIDGYKEECAKDAGQVTPAEPAKRAKPRVSRTVVAPEAGPTLKATVAVTTEDTPDAPKCTSCGGVETEDDPFSPTRKRKHKRCYNAEWKAWDRARKAAKANAATTPATV